MSLNRSSKEHPTSLPAYQKTCKKTWSQRSGEEMSGRQAEGGRQANSEWETSRQKYSNIPPQTHGGLRETILSLKVKARKGFGERGLVKISSSWS